MILCHTARMDESEVRTSSFCNTDYACVGVQLVEDGVRLLDTKDAESGFVISRKEWREFKRGMKNGDFDDLAAGD